MENVLIIGAHYDDAELGAGGTAAILSSKGCNVFKITLTDNVTNFNANNIHVNQQSSIVSSSKACEILGIKEIPFKTSRCNYLSYNTELMQQIEEVIINKKIDTVFLHFGYDTNQDHVAANALCITASRHCQNVFLFISNGYVIENQFCPNFFVDISSVIDLKIRALQQYGSEHNRYNRLFENNIERNHVWGFSNNVNYCEGFVAVKHLLN